MFASRRVLVLALTALVALARGPIGSLAIESKCTACAAVAAELGGALESERPRNHLDMRGRLDSKGQRYGKLIDYKVSELRFVELLENLCEDVASGYGYNVGVWRKGPKPKGAQGKAMRAELSGYCHRLVEEQEEALQAALYAGDLDPSTAEDVMCRQLAPKDCDGVPRRNETESEPQAEDTAAKTKTKRGKRGKRAGSESESESESVEGKGKKAEL
jgi:hypothetical protein